MHPERQPEENRPGSGPSSLQMMDAVPLQAELHGESRRCLSARCPEPAGGDAHTAPALSRDTSSSSQLRSHRALGTSLLYPLGHPGEFHQEQRGVLQGAGRFPALASRVRISVLCPCPPITGITKLRPPVLSSCSWHCCSCLSGSLPAPSAN